MDTILWNERFSVGVPAMDAQHKTLINLINALQSAGNAECTNVAITGMFDYAASHFRDEEALLRRAGYSELPTQEREHAAFLSKAAEFTGLSSDDSLPCAQITHYLRSWMLHHILEEDMKYKCCIPDCLVY